jgi:ubiquinone/menaquinone biosynthesis C-methylase UbiE
MSSSTYVLGSSPRELSRLSLQAQIIQPITERLLRESGVTRGMRVLDLGCGAGDVSLLAAEMVGPTGVVVGIDQSLPAIERAQGRTLRGDFRQIRFEASSVEEFFSADLFDVVVGRFVLIHQPSPSDFLRAAQRHVRPGGAIAFHEPICRYGMHSLPTAPLFQRMGELLKIAFEAFPSYDAAERLLEHFGEAGLPYPELFAEAPVGGGMGSPLYAWMTETIRAVTPLLVKEGAVSAEEIAIETLEDRLRYEAVGLQSQLLGAPHICAWARL